MSVRFVRRPNTYHDSVKLMRVSDELSRLSGVTRAAVVMGTALNLEMLAADGLLPDGASASADDLLIAIEGPDAVLDDALAAIDNLLAPRQTAEEEDMPARLLESVPANLAVVAVPGSYAATEAYAALRAGMHVFLFSDNVSIEDEVRLKRLAADNDLLCMGPDCGTAILNGVGLGFANRVSPGPAGIVGASGTGIQQVISLLDRSGVGIAQAIGTGGRDLSEEVGGAMSLRALRMLEEDEDVRAIGVISKPPDSAIVERLHRAMASLSKPVVAYLVGTLPEDEGSVHYARTLADAAHMLATEVGTEPVREEGHVVEAGSRSGQVYGLFAGGTLMEEAEQLLTEMNVPCQLTDLGADEFTRGRAHPLIDPRLRVAMLEDLAGHDDVGVVLLDVILGDLAHPNPAAALRPALEKLRGAGIPVIITLIGTSADPQNLDLQRQSLHDAGAMVFSTNAAATLAAGTMVTS